MSEYDTPISYDIIRKRWKMKISELSKKIFIITAIWLLSCFIISILADRYLMENFNSFLPSLILSPIGCCIAFIPTIFLLYFLFKKVINKFKRVLLTAFLIPFTNMIYFFVEMHLPDPIFSLFLGFYSLYATLPIVFITALLTPKSILPIKWYVILTDVLMWIFGWIMIYICLSFGID